MPPVITLGTNTADIRAPRAPSMLRSLGIGVGGIIVLTAAALWWLNRPHLPAYIVYDAQASAAQSLADMYCAPAIRTQCQKPVADGEVTFRSALARARDELPGCRGVFFIVDDPAMNSPQTIDLLKQAQKRIYWRLRVDYHIGRDAQESTLQRSGETSSGITDWGGSGDARQTMQNACKIARDGRVFNGW